LIWSGWCRDCIGSSVSTSFGGNPGLPHAGSPLRVGRAEAPPNCRPKRRSELLAASDGCPQEATRGDRAKCGWTLRLARAYPPAQAVIEPHGRRRRITLTPGSVTELGGAWKSAPPLGSASTRRILENCLGVQCPSAFFSRVLLHTVTSRLALLAKLYALDVSKTSSTFRTTLSSFLAFIFAQHGENEGHHSASTQTGRPNGCSSGRIRGIDSRSRSPGSFRPPGRSIPRWPSRRRDEDSRIIVDALPVSVAKLAAISHPVARGSL
jgi:hypothetical protein